MRDNPGEKPLLSIEEAGRLLGLSRSAAFRAAQRGDLGKVIQINGRRLISRAQLLAITGNVAPTATLSLLQKCKEHLATEGVKVEDTVLQRIVEVVVASFTERPKF